MVGKRRLTKPTLGVVMATGLAAIVPAGAVLEIPVSPLEEHRTVDVLWNGTALMMFVTDVETRSHPIDS